MKGGEEKTNNIAWRKNGKMLAFGSTPDSRCFDSSSLSFCRLCLGKPSLLMVTDQHLHKLMCWCICPAWRPATLPPQCSGCWPASWLGTGPPLLRAVWLSSISLALLQLLSAASWQPCPTIGTWSNWYQIKRTYVFSLSIGQWSKIWNALWADRSNLCYD